MVRQVRQVVWEECSDWEEGVGYAEYEGLGREVREVRFVDCEEYADLED